MSYPLEITIEREPWKVTAQQKRVQTSPGVVAGGRKVLSMSRKARFFHAPNYVEAERELVLRLVEARHSENAETIQEPCEVVLTLVWPYRVADRRKLMAKSGGLIPHSVRPDLDNLSKLYIDGLVKSEILDDDGLIYQLTLAKYWGPDPKISYLITT